MSFAQTLARLLTEGPASLFYHLLVGLALEGLWLMALETARRAPGAPENRAARRMALAAGLGLIGRMALFGAAFVESQWLPPGTLLPPLERAVDLATWAWIGWAMIEEAPGFWLPALHTLIAFGAYGLIASNWMSLSLQDPSLFYAATPSDRAWMLWALGLALGIGGWLLARPSPAFRSSGMLGFFALALGALLQLNMPLAGTHLAPWVRLGMLTAFPLWLAGTYRLALQAVQRISGERERAAEGWRAWSRGLLRALQAQGEPNPLDEALKAARKLLGARWTAAGLLQDDRLLIIAREGEGLPQAGTDLTLSLPEYPQIEEAIFRRPSGFLAPEDQQGEAGQRLWQAFGMETIGFLQIEPLVAQGRLLGAWLIGYPKEEKHRLSLDPGLGRQMAELLAQTLSLLQERERKATLEVALMSLQQEHEEAVRRLEAQRAEERQMLQREINRWATRAAEAEEERERWRRRAEELARLIEARASLPVVASAPEHGRNASPPPTLATAPEGHREGLILALIQELRTPLTAILGYTDLLLGEAVGILGATQRQFLLRIKANIERMAGLIRETIQIAALEVGTFQLEPGALNLAEVRDLVLQQLQPVLQERGLRVALEWPDDLPPVRVDRDAAQQILYHLLNNAALCSRPGTAIGLRARLNPEVPGVIFLHVQDTGGGIPIEEASRVFVPRYRATTPLISGVGDSIGLSIARALVEASGGRIWVESEPGTGSTFTVVLPLAS
ncbi:ATP-binding protein [Thermoflexus sp.]|uniref:sensor histidine kinase n=1 Tax=Thermoflexus sp. TaxID=1969742 RepID=UPI0025D1DD09|nr:ATP-binding protein [Thermoflexus sp.]MCS7350375.1 ATP-binding protein [Thermoflexus sp.]MCX7689920.1 ATP-binding protein [Thermoflexus sp.]MDW8179826.1 ATP-binding protein [Anaerolineae bacterium]